MKEWWIGLDSRERLMVTAGAAVLGLMLLWLLVLDPLSTELKRLRTQVPVKEQTAVWMDQQSRIIKPLMAKSRKERGDPSTPLLTVIEQTAAAHNMRSAIKRIQPGDKNDVQVWISDTYFDPWIKWVEVLKKQGIEISSTTVNRGRNDDNTVSIKATFQRS